MALIQVCDNPECEEPTGIMPVQIDEEHFLCQKCFRSLQADLLQISFITSPNKVKTKTRRSGSRIVRV